MTALQARVEKSGSEFYKVRSVGKAKCWISLNLDDGGYLQLKNTQVEESLVEKVSGKRIEVVRARDPVGTLYIAAIYHGDRLLYPTNPKNQISELDRYTND